MMFNNDGKKNVVIISETSLQLGNIATHHAYPYYMLITMFCSKRD